MIVVALAVSNQVINVHTNIMFITGSVWAYQGGPPGDALPLNTDNIPYLFRSTR